MQQIINDLSYLSAQQNKPFSCPQGFTIGIAMKHPSRTWEWLRVSEKQSMLSICDDLHTINMGASININYKLIMDEHQLTITKNTAESPGYEACQRPNHVHGDIVATRSLWEDNTPYGS